MIFFIVLTWLVLLGNTHVKQMHSVFVPQVIILCRLLGLLPYFPINSWEQQPRVWPQLLASVQAGAPSVRIEACQRLPGTLSGAGVVVRDAKSVEKFARQARYGGLQQNAANTQSLHGNVQHRVMPHLTMAAAAWFHVLCENTRVLSRSCAYIALFVNPLLHESLPMLSGSWW